MVAADSAFFPDRKILKEMKNFNRTMTEERDMVSEYGALRQKHKLPLLHDLDKEFCVGKLEETDFLLRVIVSKMSERLEQVIKILGDLIQPESQLANMYEAESFTDEEKKHIFELFKRISARHKELVINDFEHDEDSAAELIKNTFNEWKDMKKDFLKILEKTKESWQNEKKSELELGYFG